MKKIISLVALLSLMTVSAFAQTLNFYDKDNAAFTSSTVVYSGDTITLNATGYNAGATLQLRIFDGWNGYYPVYETYTAAADGSLDTTFTVPDGEYFANAGTPMFQLGPNPKWIVKTISDIKAYATGVSVDETKEVTVNGSITVSSSIIPSYADNKSVTWSSDNTNIATVNANTGVVTGITAGTCNIIALTDDGGYKDTCVVTATNTVVSVEGFTLALQATELDKLDSIVLATTFSPDNSTNKNITWTSTNEGVATVGIDGKVKGVDLGTTKIIAETDDGGYKDTCEITVVQAAFFSFDNKANYIAPNKFDTAGVMSITVNYSMGANRTINSTGIDVRLRHLNSEWAAVGYDYLYVDATHANSQSGTLLHDIDLTGAELTADLAKGDFYWLWIKATDDAGTVYEAKTLGATDSIFIVEPTATGLRTVAHRLSVYPNPAEDMLTLEGMQGAVKATIFSLDGKQLMTRKLGLSRNLNVSQLEQGNYILQVKDEEGFDVRMISVK